MTRVRMKMARTRGVTTRAQAAAGAGTEEVAPATAEVREAAAAELGVQA